MYNFNNNTHTQHLWRYIETEVSKNYIIYKIKLINVTELGHLVLINEPST